MKIKIITAYTNDNGYDKLYEYSSQSYIEYAKRNGYDFEGYLLTDKSVLPSFQKLI
jgi:hypothetical protein